MKHLLITLMVVVLTTAILPAQEKPPIVADAIALVYPGGGLLYADQPTAAAMFCVAEVGLIVWAQQNRAEVQSHTAGLVVVAFTLKAVELLETHYAAKRWNARMGFSANPVDLSPRISLTIAW